MRHLTAGVVLLVLLPAVLPAAAAQDPRTQPPPIDLSLKESSWVGLHLVDVVAVDGQGRPILGLTRENFAVEVDGSPREIAAFEAGWAPAAATGPPAGGAPASPGAAEERAGRWIVVCLDADRIPSQGRDKALATVREIVLRGGNPEDRFAVAVLRAGELRLVQQFAPRPRIDPKNLGTMDDLVTSSADLGARVRELVSVMEPCVTAGPGRESRSESRIADCVSTVSQEFLAALRQESAAGIEALRSLAAALSPLPGRKAILLLTQGFVLEPGEVVVDALSRYIEVPDALASRLEDPEPVNYGTFLAEASRAHVSVFAWRLGTDLSTALSGAERAGVGGTTSALNDPFRSAGRLAEQSLSEAARATGGRAILSQFEPRDAPAALRQLDAVYMLGIQAKQGDWSRSRIRVRLQGVKGKLLVRERLGHRLPEVAPLDIRLESDIPPPAEFRGEVAVRLVVDTSRLGTVPGTGPPGAKKIAIYARLLGMDGRTRTENYRIVDLPGGGEDSNYVHSMVFRLPAGQWIAQVAVTDLHGPGRAAVDAPLTVGAPPEVPGPGATGT